MPQDALNDLLDSVKDALPKRNAQEIYRAAYNSAWNEYNQKGCCSAFTREPAGRL